MVSMVTPTVHGLLECATLFNQRILTYAIKLIILRCDHCGLARGTLIPMTTSPMEAEGESVKMKFSAIHSHPEADGVHVRVSLETSAWSTALLMAQLQREPSPAVLSHPVCSNS